MKFLYVICATISAAATYAALSTGLLVSLPLSNMMSLAATTPLPQAISPLMGGDYLVAAPGRVEPETEELRIGASVTGVLSELLVEEGDHVKRNDIVARLESDDYKASLAKAEAQLRLDEAQLQKVLNGARAAERREAATAVREAETIETNAGTVMERRRKLGVQGFASQEVVDQAQRESAVARARLQAARERYALVNDPARDEDVAIAKARVAASQAARDEAQAALNKTVIRSPIDGTVLRVSRRPGELLTIFLDQPILTVGNLATLYVRAEVDEADIAKLQSGLSAFVTADAFGDQRFTGRVFRVGQTLGRKNIRTDDPKERSDAKVLEVLIALDAPNPLLPGLRVNAFIMPPRVSELGQVLE